MTGIEWILILTLWVGPGVEQQRLPQPSFEACEQKRIEWAKQQRTDNSRRFAAICVEREKVK